MFNNNYKNTYFFEQTFIAYPMVFLNN